MILIGSNKDLFIEVQDNYEDKIIIIDPSTFKNDKSTKHYPINLLEFIKFNIDKYDIIYIIFDNDIFSFLTAIKLDCKFIGTKDEIDNLKIKTSSLIILDEKYTLSNFLSQFDWFNIETQMVESKSSIIPEHKMKTLQELIDDDGGLTSNDIVDVKLLQNKLKMGVLLQAKSLLNRVLKLSNILDKLYDELLDRIEDSLDTTDTPSLMYTTDYISKALTETNQFIVTLVNNEKIQNFFIIDNSTIINNNSNEVFDVDKREKIRKVAEIILNNYENLAEGNLDNVVDPKSAIEINQENSSTGDSNLEK